MAIAYRDSSKVYTDTGVATTTCPLPSGAVDGDWLLAAFVSPDTVAGAALTAEPASDWTVLAAHDSFGTASSALYWTVKTPTTSTPSWTLDSAKRSHGVVVAYSGVDTTAPVNVSAETERSTSANTVESPTVTTTAASCMVVRLFGEKGTPSSNIATDPSGTTRRLFGYGAGSPGVSVLVVDALQVAAGASGTKTATYNQTGSSGDGWTIALTAAAEPASPPPAEAGVGGTDTFPSLVVEAAFSTASTGTYLHLNDPIRGKLDTATLAPDEIWTDITEWHHRCTINRSANVDAVSVRYEPGTATLELKNTDRRFDPANLAGPYVSGGVTQVAPMRAVRIRAIWNSVSYDLFRGYFDSVRVVYNGPNYSRAIIQCSDATKVLQNFERSAVAAVGAGELSGARVNRVLDDAGWSATDRDVATGDSTLQATTLDGAAWDELLQVADSEAGELYIDGAGRVVWRNRLAIISDTRSNISQATFGDEDPELRYTDLELTFDQARLANRILATRTGGTTQTVNDSQSQQTNLIHVHTRDGLWLQTDDAAQDLASWLLHFAKDPELRFDTLSVNPLKDPTDLFPQVLQRTFGDRITVKRRPPGGGDPIIRDVFIRGITHEIEPMQWSTEWALQSASNHTFLILDHPDFGVLDSNYLAF